MDKLFLKELLKRLQPKTLAYMARDLENVQADWAYYPEDAPPEADRHALLQLLETIQTLGPEQAAAAGLDFDQLLEQASEDEPQEDWPSQRNQQVQQNWLSDLQ